MDSMLICRRFNHLDEAIKWANGLRGLPVPGHEGWITAAIVQFQFERHERSVELALLVRVMWEDAI